MYICPQDEGSGDEIGDMEDLVAGSGKAGNGGVWSLHVENRFLHMYRRQKSCTLRPHFNPGKPGIVGNPYFHIKTRTSHLQPFAYGLNLFFLPLPIGPF